MRLFTIAVFMVLAGLVVLLALTGRRDALGIAPFGDLLDRIMVSRATRLSIVLFWWWIGWHFLVVQTVDP